MKDRYLYKAKWIDTGEWVDGNLIVNGLDTREYFIGNIFDNPELLGRDG